MMDGASLTKSRAQWEAALNTATDSFRSLVAESSSKAWKLVPQAGAPNASLNASNTGSLRGLPSATSPNLSAIAKGKAKEQSLKNAKSNGDLRSTGESTSTTDQQSLGPFKLGALRVDAVKVHRKSGKGLDVYRAVAQVPFDGESDLKVVRSMLQTPDVRSVWDRLVESSELIEQLDPNTRICKTNYKLGWPASPRDAITISRTLTDDTTLIDVSTSLPRSPDAPAYLRPAPPCVRSHVHLTAWCVQILPKNQVRFTAFWSWDLKGAWMGMPSGGIGMHLPDLIKGLVKQIKEAAGRLPSVLNYGTCVEMLFNSFDSSRDTLQTEYAIVIEDETARQAEDRAEKDLDTLNIMRARRKLEAGIEFSLPAVEGWDVQVTVKTQTKSSQNSTWQANAEKAPGSHRILLTLKHARLEDADEIVKVKVKVQRVAASTGLRLNDEPFDIIQSEPRTATALSQPVLEDTASVSGISVGTASTGDSATTPQQALGLMANASRGGTPNPGSPSAINALIRRNYIYFTSLLQEPEAKWKPVSDMRGVTVTQLDSIDPTLVVYRAEATFVGVGVWDLFSTISNPGSRAFWDKGLDDAMLLSDINDLSALWHLKTRAAWPVSARDSVTVQTSYKSAASVHVFSFSTDDRAQFPDIPVLESGTIRTQVDLRGWSIESLSPTTIHITMMEQSDPKGWTSKSAIPSAMINAVSGVGDYAIKFGGPPVATRLLGAQAKISKYDHEKATFRIEYEANDLGEDDFEAPNVECEIRCDVETWAQSLDLVVDPPPISVSCLRRHKLSQGGGGLWLTIEHVAASLEDDVARITVRKGTSREKGSVFVNGAQMKVDVDELKQDQVQQLKEQKRTKPQRVPLDLTNPPPKAPPKGIDSSASSVVGSEHSETPGTNGETQSNSILTVRAGRTEEQPSPPANTFFSDEKPRQPMTCALDVLFLLRRIHAERSPDPAGSPAGWALVSERNGLYVRRKLMESISNTVVVQRGDKVVQGLSAEDLVDVVSSIGCRKQWDDKVESTTPLGSYGNGTSTSFITTKASFPFRGRAFHLASLTARVAPPASVSSPTASDNVTSTLSAPAVYFHASASFPDQNSKYPMAKLNPQALPMGKILIDGWILETLDPYSSTSFQIPSTRCTHVVAVDYAGSLPVAVNTIWNSNLPRSVLLIEDFLKARGALPSVKTPPPCVQVLGDGRDEDQGLVWVLDDPERKHVLLSSTFEPNERVFTALSMTYGAKNQPKAIDAPLRKQSSISDVSTTKGAVMKAASMTPMAPSLSKDSNSSLSRATSVTSIAASTATATTLRARPSSIRTDSRRLSDMLLMEVEVELRHFSKGYDVQVFSEHLPKAEGTVPLTLAKKPKQDLPVQIKVFDLPPSAVLAATLDPSARPRKHLVRVSLPTTQFLNPIEDPLTEQKAPDVPDWFTQLQEHGAVLRLVVRPLKAGTDAASTLATFSTPAGKIAVKSNDVKLDVTHVNQTSIMLQKEPVGASLYAQLRRATPPPKVDGEDARLPPLLREPIAADLEIKEPHVEPSKPEVKSDPPPPAEKAEPPKAPEKPTKQAEPSSAGQQLMNILGSYPLSRSALASVSSVTANGRSTTSRSTDPPSDVAKTPDPAPLVQTIQEEVARPRFLTSSLILVAIIAFLLGSLMRSLLSPVDYLLIPSGLTEEVERYLSGLGPATGWTEMRRLLQIKRVWGWSLVLAVVRG